MKGSLWHQRHAASSEGTRQTRRFSPLLFGLSAIVYMFGQLIWLLYILAIHKVPPYPGTTHFIEIFTYPFLIIAVLLLPSRGLPLFTRLCIFLDSLIIMAAVTTLCYYFLLAPVLVEGHGTLLEKVVGGLYPFLDLLFMFCVLVVALHSGERALRPVLLLLLIGSSFQFMSNVIHLYDLLAKAYDEFSFARLLLIFFGTFLVGASQTVNTLIRKGETAEPDPAQAGAWVYSERWKLVSPSALALIFGLLVFAIWLSGKQSFPDQIVSVYIGGAIVLGLMILRQFLTMYQIGVLQQQLWTKNRSLDGLNAQLERRATTDPLTGLPNHRSLVEKLDQALAGARATLTPCSLIFLDLDHFKQMNDRFGHLAGDAALCRFASIVTRTVRPCDTVGRWGGEEFLAILPQTSPLQARSLAERLRREVQQLIAVEGKFPPLTCSLGVATAPHDASEREELIKQADRAMYTAKRLGRNQVRTARELLVQASQEQMPLAGGGHKTRLEEIAEALLALTEARDPALNRHARRVALLSSKLAQELQLTQEEVRMIALGGLLHNLGRIALPDARLLTHGWRDSGRAEQEDLARSALTGAEILTPIPTLRSLAAIVRSHAEWIDGSGSPAGLQGEKIPLGTRIIAVASTYDTSLDGRPTGAVLEELRQVVGSRLDARIVEALARVLAVSPHLSAVGTE